MNSNMDNITVAIDAMGGDHGPSVTIPAAINALKKYSHLNLILVGDEQKLSELVTQYGSKDNPRIEIHHASQVVEMDEPPSRALRGKKDSSMRVAINLVKDGKAQACVSAGNTGALMATSRFVLKTLSGINRPAIISALPTVKGHTHMLDLGANIDSSAEVLYQFALMGSVLTRAVDNIENPTVGLLNIGEEEIKGNEQVKAAHKILSESDLNYIGYVEGDGIYTDAADVIVADGFIGNIALKSSEGVAKMISHAMKNEFKRNIFTKLSALIALPVLNAFKKRIDPRSYNGASLVGLRGIVIKSHGSADSLSFATAIGEAVLEVKTNVPKLIASEVEAKMDEGRADKGAVEKIEARQAV
ncbi:MAG: phosphate acyltransferase PlsX [Chromatiales bacterium]|nr:phosphate acyltransferase PlsX [Chromatiales bacterium]